MRKLNLYWEKISNSGVRRAAGNNIKQIRLCNQVAISVSIAAIVYIFIFMSLGLIGPGLSLILLSILFFLPIPINHFGYFITARICALFTISLGIIFYAFLFGKAAGLQLVFFISLAMSWALFDKNHRHYVIYAAIINMASYFIIEMYFVDPYLDMRSSVQQLLCLSMVFVTFILVSLFIYRLILENFASEQKLMEQKIKLEQANHYKSEFLSNMSHELRTPLNSILLLAKLLSDNRKNNLSEKQVEYSKVIYKSGNNLLMMINDILDLSKIEAGKIELLSEDINIKELLNDQYLLFNEIACEKRITFTIANTLDENAVLMGDKMKLEQILRNLLSNAFKFTPRDGAIMLELKIASNQNDFVNNEPAKSGTILSIAVKDSGIGVPVEKQQAIFEAFQQADGSTGRKYGGTGLGLFITKELTRIMGGEIQIESVEGRGSTFTVYLPCNLKVQAPIIISHETGSTDLFRPYLFQNKTTLLVDDDDRNIFSLSVILKDLGMDIIPASNGKEALEKLQLHIKKIDIVLTDIMMPEINGYELIKLIRQDPLYNEVPVIALTARAMKGEREKCLEAGASEYLAKPVEKEKLISVMMDLLQKSAPLQTADQVIADLPSKTYPA